MNWAAAVTSVYLEGALARALAIAHQPLVLADLASAEYEALDDAERLEAASQVERAAADIDEQAAAAARETAIQIHRERVAAQGAVGAGLDVVTQAANLRARARAPRRRMQTVVGASAELDGSEIRRLAEPRLHVCP